MWIILDTHSSSSCSTALHRIEEFSKIMTQALVLAHSHTTPPSVKFIQSRPFLLKVRSNALTFIQKFFARETFQKNVLGSAGARFSSFFCIVLRPRVRSEQGAWQRYWNFTVFFFVAFLTQIRSNEVGKVWIFVREPWSWAAFGKVGTKVAKLDAFQKHPDWKEFLCYLVQRSASNCVPFYNWLSYYVWAKITMEQIIDQAAELYGFFTVCVQNK